MYSSCVRGLVLLDIPCPSDLISFKWGFYRFFSGVGPARYLKYIFRTFVLGFASMTSSCAFRSLHRVYTTSHFRQRLISLNGWECLLLLFYLVSPYLHHKMRTRERL